MRIKKFKTQIINFLRTIPGKIVVCIVSVGAVALIIALPITFSQSKKHTENTHTETVEAIKTPKTLSDFVTKFPQFANAIVDNKVTNNAFHGKDLPTDFWLPDSLVEIGQDAFSKATLHKGFKLPDSVNLIGKNAFRNTTLPDVFMLPKSVKELGVAAFSGALLPSGFTLANTSITSIADWAFSNGSNRNTVIPDGFAFPSTLEQIGEYCFANDTLPKGFTLANTSVKSIGTWAFSNGTDGEMVIPDGFAFPSTLEQIGEKCFMNDTLPKGFTLANTSVKSIGNQVFRYSIFSDGFALPTTLTSIGEYSFYSAKGLPKGFTLANTAVTRIEKHTFDNTVLPDGFALPSTLTWIGENAFESAKLSNTFVLPDSLTTIAGGAFAGAENFPDNFTIPNKVTWIEGFAFSGVTLPDGFSIPTSVTYIGDDAFQTASLPNGFSIPKTVTQLGRGVLAGVVYHR